MPRDITGSTIGVVQLREGSMNKLISKSVKLFFAFSIVFSSAVPLHNATGSVTDAEIASEPTISKADVQYKIFEQVEEASDEKIDQPEYEVVQNADPYLHLLGLNKTTPKSQYGPNRNDPEQGIPAHAYSPFDDLDEREVCPPGGCDYVLNRLLIKFEPDQTFNLMSSNQILLQDQALASTLAGLEITNLSPIFPNAEKPAPGEMIETVDGDLIAKPDLTRWFQAVSNSDKGFGEIIQTLQTTAGIAHAEPDYIRKPVGEMSAGIEETSGFLSASPALLPGSTTDPLYDQQWHLGATHVPEAWAYLESQGLPPGGSRDIVVAVIDTGVDYTHPDLAANIWVNPAEFNGVPGVDDDGNGYVDDIHGADTVYPDGDPMDDHGHGTHVAGIIAAQADNGIGGVGVAYNVQVMPLKAAQYSGVLAASDIAEAIYYAVAKGADVINMSFGGYARSTVEEDALSVAFGQAILIAAAGNDGKSNEFSFECRWGSPMYPAAYNWVLGVMASTTGNSEAFFSNWDCKLEDVREYELYAPGVTVWSTLPGDQYSAWSGTSMAAPVVSGIAALARTKWYDKDWYSSRFIMGQIASNTSQSVVGVANALDAITIPPRPKLSYLEYWLFDTSDIDPINDNDGIVDAGETVDLAILIRNHWGKADNVTVTLEALAEGAVFPDPYVLMITDTVSYGAIGSFIWDDNGLIYDPEGAITGVQNPFRFAVTSDAPNDHLIPFRLTLIAENGYDPEDPDAPYTFVDNFFLIVQKGKVLPLLIDEDMILTKDYYWIVSNPSLVTEGTLLSITEGTQLQFYTGEPGDPYAENIHPFIQVAGSLQIQGTPDDPVEIFTSINWNEYPIQIRQILGGYSAIQYAKVINPIIGHQGEIFSGTGGGIPLDSLSHILFSQNFDNCIRGYDYQNERWNDCSVGELPRVNAQQTNYSIFHNLGYPGNFLYDLPLFVLYPVSYSLFDRSVVHVQKNYSDNNLEGNTFINNCKFNAQTDRLSASEAIIGRLNDQVEDTFVNNAILNKYINPNPDYWMKFYMDYNYGNILNIENNYWGTLSSTIINSSIIDFFDNVNLGIYQYEPILTTAPETAYPFVVDVRLSTATDPDASEVGAEPVTFTITFNRDMDQAIQPQVSFGPDVPMTDYTIHPIDGGWTDARTWVGTFNITPITGDGYQLIRVAGAVAADDPWLVTGDDAGRFRFEVITSGTEAMNLQATGGEGYVDLMWTQSDFELLSGFHLYRSTSMDGTYLRINSAIIPPEIRNYRDTDVVPGQIYYYKFTVVKSDMTESDFSNTTTATPLDTIPPVLIHTAVTSAPPGQPLTLVATATDNVTVTAVTLYYRHVGDTTYTITAMVRTTGNDYYATIEGSLLSSPGIEYYIEATDGISITRNGRAENPNLVSVVDRPVVTIVTPNTGPAAGGTAVTITGSNFKSGATVTFGGAAASNVTFVSTNQLTCNTPAHIPETVDVRVTNPDAQFGVLLNGFTFFSTAAQISLPNTGGGTGNVVTVPINAANINGMLAAGLTVNFDPAVLSVQSASTGALTAGWAFASNLIAPGQYRLSMSNSSAVSGAGTMANIEFLVTGAPGTSSMLSISNILLNDGAITVELADGLFSVDDVYNVSGLVSFWNGGAPVSGALLTLTGDQVYSAMSGLDGNYSIQGAAIDSYDLTPSKENGDNGISAYDASFALQHDVGLTTLTGNQALAADVNNNGYINSMDAAYILQKTAGLISLPFPGSGVVWKFTPTSRNIPELTGNITAQDFTAILLGDISGSWIDPGEGLLKTGDEINLASANLTIPPVNVLPVGSIDVPINLDITDAELLGADIAFTYDPTHVNISNLRIGSLATGWSLVSNLSEPGVIRIAMAGAVPITTDGELILFTVTALGAQGTQSALTLTFGDLNESAIPSTLNSGSVYIAVPVTAEFSATPTSGPAPLAVTFTNLSTGDWSTVSWNFGDGATSTDSNPSHIYTVPGTYTVSLIVIGSGGSDIETKTDYIQVSSLNVSGSVLYWNENKAVPGTVCTLSGDNTYSDTTDLSGDFSISGILAGNYNLIPSKHDQVNGITAYDAALVLRDVAEIETLSGYPAIAADVNQSGEISSLDASYILQKSVGLIETFPDITSMWLFDPVNYTYSNLLEDQINQNFAGVLLGDPTGNWSIEGGTMGLVQLEPSSILTIVATPPDVDGNVTATIYLDPNGTETYGLDLILQYDSTHAELVNVSKGEIGDNWIFATNYSEDGVIRLGIADTQPLAEKQSIAVVEFHLLDLGRTSEFLPVYGSVNEDAIPIDMLGSTLGEVSYKIFIPVIVR